MTNLTRAFCFSFMLWVCIPSAQSEDTIALNIERAWCEHTFGEARPDDNCRLGDVVVISTSNLDKWADVNTKRKPANLVLILNGELLKGSNGTIYGGATVANPQPGETPQKSAVQIRFHLNRQTTEQGDINAWRKLLAKSKLVGTRTMDLRIGLEDGSASYDAGEIQFQVAAKKYQWFIIAIFIGLVLAFLILVRKSDIIRIQYQPSDLAIKQKKYSMGRMQMAWWFFIIVGSFLYIWMFTGDLNSLNDTILILVGISTATGFSAAVLDKSKRTEIEAKRMTLAIELNILKENIKELTELSQTIPSPQNLADINQLIFDSKVRLKEKEQHLNSLSNFSPKESQGFFLDILQDENGVTFYRFQILAWTVLLGIVFVRTVFTELSMPEFDATLLGILGISSGTYVGFKFPAPPKE